MLKVLFTLFFIFSLINISYGNEIDCKYIKENQATKQVLDDYYNKILLNKSSEDIIFDLLKYLFSEDKEKFILNSLPYSKFDFIFKNWTFDVIIFNSKWTIYSFNIKWKCVWNTCNIFSYAIAENLHNINLSQLDRKILAYISSEQKYDPGFQKKNFMNSDFWNDVIKINDEYSEYLGKTRFKHILNNYKINWNNIENLNKEYIDYIDKIQVLNEYIDLPPIEWINLSIIQECSNSNNIISNDWEKNSKINYYIIIIILWVIILLIYFRKRIFNFKKD